jgi:hypothetical protein
LLLDDIVDVKPSNLGNFLSGLSAELSSRRNERSNEKFDELLIELAFKDLISHNVWRAIETNFFSTFSNGTSRFFFILVNLTSWERPRLGVPSFDEENIFKILVNENNTTNRDTSLIADEGLDVRIYTLLERLEVRAVDENLIGKLMKI